MKNCAKPCWLLERANLHDMRNIHSGLAQRDAEYKHRFIEWLVRTLQSAGRCAGRRVAAHAGLADIHALAHQFRVVILVQLRDADPLLIAVSRLIGTAGQEQDG